MPEADDKNIRGVQSRRLALETLIKIERDKAYANLALSAAFKRKTLSERDRAFVTHLVQGVVRNQSAIDEVLASLSHEPIEKMHFVLRNVLRLAIYQLRFMSDLPPSAVLDTSNRLARACGHEGMVKFANGVLRNYVRQMESGSAVESSADDADSLSKKYSLPQWLIDRWTANFGAEEALKLAEWSQSTPQLTVRASEMSIEPAGLKRIFDEKGFPCRHGELVHSCLIFVDQSGKKTFRGSPSKLPGFEEGLFMVQDEAAAFVSVLVAPEKGEVIVDLCAAPGGKTVHMAELMENTGKVIAIDKNTSRLNMVKAARRKLGLTNIEAKGFDGRTFRPDAKVDRVLVDAPCSGTGVINRRSDIRSHREAVDLISLSEMQKELVFNAAEMLKPGGTLVYSTCSIEPEENREVIQWLLSERNDLIPFDLTPLINQKLLDAWFPESRQAGDHRGEREAFVGLTRESLREGFVQFLPSRHGVSGFFVCRLTKR